jgi:hypothetical protein
VTSGRLPGHPGGTPRCQHWRVAEVIKVATASAEVQLDGGGVTIGHGTAMTLVDLSKPSRRQTVASDDLSAFRDKVGHMTLLAEWFDHRCWSIDRLEIYDPHLVTLCGVIATVCNGRAD